MNKREMIKIENLHKSYGSLHVLKDINMSVYESEVVCLVGASGSGKSTLLRCLNFLEKREGGKFQSAGKKLARKPTILTMSAKRWGWFSSTLIYSHIKPSLKILLKHPLW